MTERQWIGVTTLGDLIDQRAAEHPDREAVVFPDNRYTYADLADRAQLISKGLLSLGVGAGDRVGYFLHECIDTLAILLGAAKIGAITAPINARFKSVELGQVVVHAGMKVVFTSRPPEGTDFVGLLHETFPEVASATSTELDLVDAPELRAIVVLDSDGAAGMMSKPEFLAAAATVDDAAVEHRQQAVRVRDTAVIMYTSGTTAMPKGAMLSHEAFIRFADGTCNSRMPMDGSDKVWTALPLFHIGGVAFGVGALFAGATFVHVGFYNPNVALGQLRDEPCTVALPGFETIWLPILGSAERGDHDFDSLRVLLCAGVEERLRQIQDETPDAVLVSCFGQTEACAFLSLSELEDSLDLRTTTGGLPMPGMECEVHDPETDELLAPGSTGELWYRGPMAFDGYFRDPETTADVFDERGFFKTGDVAHMDEDGRVTFVSRVKDMLKVGGENVAAAEVEGYLLTHPAVQIAQVVSAPDAKYVEVPTAYIQLKEGETATEQEIIDFCRGKIATFRVPRYVRFVSEWPMSGTKVKKYVLREEIAKELADAGITEAPQIKSS
ncbi:MAG: class I adenylate-forming enzyme family protein [Acidimicrobiales bacterium]